MQTFLNEIIKVQINFNEEIDVLFLLNKKEAIFNLNDGGSFKCFNYMNVVHSVLRHLD